MTIPRANGDTRGMHQRVLLRLIGVVALATPAVAEGPSFDYEVVPTLYKLGCSAGECHVGADGRPSHLVGVSAGHATGDSRGQRRVVAAG